MTKLFSQLSVFFFLLLLSVTKTWAVDADIQSAVGGVTTNPSPFSTIGGLITNIYKLVLYAAGLGFFIFLLIGGLRWILSGGDKAGVEAARNSITNAIIGLVIVVAAYAITRIVEVTLGLKIL